MPAQPSTKKRRQYTSCDACRTSRLGCDAALLQQQRPWLDENVIVCSNCTRRGIDCTFNYVRTAKHKRNTEDKDVINANTNTNTNAGAAATGSVATSTAAAGAVSKPASLPTTSTSSVSNRLANQFSSRNIGGRLFQIYSILCEGAISIWLDADCCPLPSASLTSSNPSGHNLLSSCRKLDLEASRSSPSMAYSQQTSALLDDTLITVMQAYASQWLWNTGRAADTTTDNSSSRYRTLQPSPTSALNRELWYRCRDKVNAAMATPSYRSMLALVLFAWTPVPKDAQELADHDASLSLDNALLLYYRLRPEERLDKASAGTNDSISDYGAVCWFGVIINVASATLHRRPPVLQSAMESSQLWNVVDTRDRSYVEYFSRISKADITNELMIHVCRAASASKLHTWKKVNNLQSALYRGERNLVIINALIKDASDQFDHLELVYGHILAQAKLKFAALSPYIQMSWAMLQSHIHVGYLLFAEAMEQVAKFDHIGGVVLIDRIVQMKKRSGRAIITTAQLVIGTPLAPEFLNSAGLPGFSNIFVLDPFPEFVTEALRMGGRALLDIAGQDDVSYQEALDSAQICLEGLKGLAAGGTSLRGRASQEDLLKEMNRVEAEARARASVSTPLSYSSPMSNTPSMTGDVPPYSFPMDDLLRSTLSNYTTTPMNPNTNMTTPMTNNFPMKEESPQAMPMMQPNWMHEQLDLLDFTTPMAFNDVFIQHST